MPVTDSDIRRVELRVAEMEQGVRQVMVKDDRATDYNYLDLASGLATILLKTDS